MSIHTTIPHKLARIALCTVLVITGAKHGCAQSISRQKLGKVLAGCGSMRVLASHRDALYLWGIEGLLPLACPIWDDFTVSSGFGMRMHPIFRQRRFHRGLDLACPLGTRIHATADGIVSFSGNKGGYGRCVIVRHGYGFETLYGHMVRTHATVGQRLRRGDVIGFVGSSGLSTGPHLHYEIRKRGQAIEPVIHRP